MTRDELRKEMAEIFRARARRIRDMSEFPTNEQVADAWDASADELDPPAKELGIEGWTPIEDE